MASGVWSFGEPSAAAPRPPVRARYSAEDMLALVWRRRFLMLAVFVLITALGLAAALRMKPTYTAHSSLLIRLGQEYVFNPRVGDAGRGAVPQTDEVIQSEMEILTSAEIKARVVEDIGIARLFPELAAAAAAARTPEARRKVEGEAVSGLEKGLKAGAAPDTAIVRLSFTHKDARTAALVVNTLVDEYLRYRKTVLLARDLGPLEGQRRAFSDQLAALDGEYTRFLNENGVGDFEAEKASLGALYTQLLTDGASARAQLSETEGRLGVTQRQAASNPAEISLYRDLDRTAGDQLAKLKVELQDLAARYRPESQPVRDKAAQVASMERLAAIQNELTAARRIGPNPVFQTLQTERNTLQAQAQSLRARSGAVTGELARVVARRQRLAELEPRYQDLQRRREVLAANVRSFTQREQESQAAQALAAGGDDGDVRVVQRAFVPTRGSSLKRPVLLAAAAFGAFAALCAGVLAAFLSRGFPTARSAERTLEMPVLATVPARARA